METVTKRDLVIKLSNKTGIGQAEVLKVIETMMETVTSELAMQGTPMIVAYRTGWLTWALARGLLYKKRHITLLNIVSDDQEIVPEFVQTRQKPGLIAETAIQWLSEPKRLQAQKEAQQAALVRMQVGDHSSAEISG